MDKFILLFPRELPPRYKDNPTQVNLYCLMGLGLTEVFVSPKTPNVSSGRWSPKLCYRGRIEVLVDEIQR